MGWALWLLLVQATLPEDLLLLAQIKTKMRANLERLPNYTCRMEIERGRRILPARRYQLIDRVRLEVALLGGRELFAWPGASEFEEREIRDLLPGGMTGTGNFGLHARSVFVSEVATFRRAPDEERDGRPQVRFDFSVPRFASGWTLKMGALSGVSGYRGSLWADRETLELRRLAIIAHDISEYLDVSATTETVDYQAATLSGGRFLLPALSVSTMSDRAGNESINRTEFTSCRHFSGESTISFADPGDLTAPPEPPKPVTFALPAGLQIRLDIETEIEFGRSAIGDEVRARVAETIRLGKQVLLPKGAIARGRVARLDRDFTGEAGANIGIRFDRIETEAGAALWRARLIDAGNNPQPTPSRMGPAAIPGSHQVIFDPARPLVGLIHVRGSRPSLSKGFKTVWLTEALESEKKD